MTVAERNAETERKEIEWLRTGPDRVFLYVTQIPGPVRGTVIPNSWQITTWPGTVVGIGPTIGPRRRMGFGFHSYRRSVDCRIFGIRYVGWYYESSGDYCRLRKAKRQ